MDFDNTFGVLKEGLSAAARRHELIADNIANISTPDYRRQDLNFKAMMQRRIENDTSFRGTTTNSRHISLNGEESSNTGVFVFSPNDTEIKSDHNNVDLDKEIVNMSNNNVYYNALTTLIGRKFRGLKDVILGRGA